MVQTLSEITTRIPENAARIINKLIERGYYSSVSDFARQSIIDKLTEDLEIKITELEPDLNFEEEKKNEK